MSDTTTPTPTATRRLLHTLLPVVLLASGCTAAADDARMRQRGELPTVTVLTSTPWMGADDTWLWLAKAAGLDRAHGLNLQPLPGGGQYNTVNAILMRLGPDAVIVDINTMILLREWQGASRLRIIAAINQHTTACLLSTYRRPITTPQGLTGKHVGVFAGGTSSQLLPLYLRQAGLDPHAVEQEVIGTIGNLHNALSLGQVDAITDSRGCPADLTIDPTRTVLPYADLLPDLYGAGLAAGPRLLAQPILRAKFLAMVAEAIEFTHRHPDETVALLAEHLPGTDPDQIGAHIRAATPYNLGAAPGAVDPDRIARTITALRAIATLPADLEPADIIHTGATHNRATGGHQPR